MNHAIVKNIKIILECPIIYATCYFHNVLLKTFPDTCATGTGRSTDIALLCACELGYQEVVDQVDCQPLCD